MVRPSVPCALWDLFPAPLIAWSVAHSSDTILENLNLLFNVLYTLSGILSTKKGAF